MIRFSMLYHWYYTSNSLLEEDNPRCRKMLIAGYRQRVQYIPSIARISETSKLSKPFTSALSRRFLSHDSKIAVIGSVSFSPAEVKRLYSTFNIVNHSIITGAPGVFYLCLALVGAGAGSRDEGIGNVLNSIPKFFFFQAGIISGTDIRAVYTMCSLYLAGSIGIGRQDTLKS